jgi:hypothetical protein
MDGLVIRHEAGHLGGLMHTSEIEGGFHDPLSDTAECADPWNMLYECKDATNIMFPIALEPTGTFSPNQRRIIQGSTLYRGELVYATQSGGQQDPAPGGDKASEAARGRGHGGPAMTPPAGVRSLARGSWTTGLDPRVARVLASHWCGEPYWQAGRLPYPALLAKLGADPAGLLRVGADASAPAPIRARALKVAGRLAAEQAGARGRPGLSPPQVSRLVTLARGRAEPRPVRLAAMTALRAAAATAARALGPALRTDADPIVAHAAERPR